MDTLREMSKFMERERERERVKIIIDIWPSSGGVALLFKNNQIFSSTLFYAIKEPTQNVFIFSDSKQK